MTLRVARHEQHGVALRLQMPTEELNSNKHILVAGLSNRPVTPHRCSSWCAAAAAQVIIFSFSKKECEALALQMQALELNNADEAALVDGVFWNAVDCLSEADRRLPQIGAILPMLKRGVGVHHSGLLPILKEVIEILFQEGLLKARPLLRPTGPPGSQRDLYPERSHKR